MYYNDNTFTLDILSKLFGDMQYIHNADETTLCMLCSLQAACTRPQFGYPLAIGRFALCFVAGKGSANPFSRHFIRWILIWSLLTGSSPEQRVVAKAKTVKPQSSPCAC